MAKRGWKVAAWRNVNRRRPQSLRLLGGELLNLMYLQVDYDMAALMELPSIEAASGLLKAVRDSGAWEDMMMFPEFDLDAGLKAINAVKSSYKTPGKE